MLPKVWEIGFWINLGEAVTTIQIEGSAQVLQTGKTTILVNGVEIDFGEDISYIRFETKKEV